MNMKDQTTQNGAALITSLMFLLVLTIIGIASMGTTTLQERMANNTREQNLAFQAAEAALRDGEAWLFAQKGTGAPPLPVNTCSSNCATEVNVWSAGTTQLNNVETATWNWWLSNGREHGGDTRDLSGDLHARQPRFIVQRMPGTAGAAAGSLGTGFGPEDTDMGPYLYRIYGYGVGRVEYESGGDIRHFDALVESTFRISQF